VNGEGKIHIKILAPVAAAIGLAIAAGHWGRPADRYFKEKCSAAQAQAFFCQGRLSQRGVERAAGAAGQFQQCPGLPHHGRTGGCGAFTRHAGLVPAAGGIVPHHGQQTPAGLRGIAVSRPAPLTSQMLDDLSTSAAKPVKSARLTSAL